MAQEVPPKVQHQLAQFQQLQQQAQAIINQKFQLQLQLKETERALEELGKLTTESEVYKSVGVLLIKSDKPVLEKELNEKKETLDLRIKTIEKQEERIRKRLEELQQQLRQALGVPTPPAG
ncbi:MAG: prefoldin subunit beta [Euryarchaeota archaeon]|nr:prefoldin subunit beta [Euryarchaeota archaeon]